MCAVNLHPECTVLSLFNSLSIAQSLAHARKHLPPALHLKLKTFEQVFFFLSLYSFVSKTFHLVTQQTCRLTNVLGIQDGMKEVLSLKRPVTALARFMSTQHKLKSSEKRNLG